jgi:hypothetical protein
VPEITYNKSEIVKHEYRNSKQIQNGNDQNSNFKTKALGASTPLYYKFLQTKEWLVDQYIFVVPDFDEIDLIGVGGSDMVTGVGQQYMFRRRVQRAIFTEIHFPLCRYDLYSYGINSHRVMVFFFLSLILPPTFF